jgi:hypothetical protein
MEIGATLRQAREARKLTADNVSRATRIPVHIIHAMEQDDWKRVPPGIFARGYLRAYAREVGLDGNALALRLQAEQAPPSPPPEQEVKEPERPTLVVRWPSVVVSESARRWAVWPALPLLLFVAYLAGRSSIMVPRPMPAPASTPSPVTASGTGGQDGTVVGTAAKPATPAMPAPQASDTVGQGSVVRGGVEPPSGGPDAPLVVEIAVTRPCWVTASADGVRTVYRVVRPGERVQARGRTVTFRVGDAGAVQLSLDGLRARPLGSNGEVLSLRITRQNAASLLLPGSGT